jgi:hypothetical protein
MYLPIGHAAGEGDEVDARVGEQLVGDLARVAGDHAEHLRRQAGLVQQVGQQQRRQRHLLDGLSTMRLLVATLGTTLCATWFIGWLNGVMAVMTPSSGSRRCAPALPAVRRDVAGEGLAVVAQRLAVAPNISTSATRPAS